MIVIAGGGVVGLHVGIALAVLPNRPAIFVCEQEHSLGAHTSGRNSEVIHAGFAYPPKSLKARLCVEGNALTYEWLQRLGVPFKREGKWIVALERDELPALNQVLETGAACGVRSLRQVTAAEVARSEPGCRPFAGAVYSGSSGIMDTAEYIRALERYFSTQPDCYFLAPCSLTAIDPARRVVTTTRGSMEYSALVNAAGLWADDVYAMAGGKRAFKIRSFKGEYYSWRHGPVRSMVYAVPRRYLPEGAGDARQVSAMGIHVHRAVSGDVFVGPTQVELDWSQKGDYRLTTPREEFVDAAARFCEVPDPEALSPAYAGNRPKLYEDGVPLADFQVVREGAEVHVLGIESPGLTAAPALGRYVARLVREAIA